MRKMSLQIVQATIQGNTKTMNFTSTLASIETMRKSIVSSDLVFSWKYEAVTQHHSLQANSTCSKWHENQTWTKQTYPMAFTCHSRWSSQNK